MQKIKALALLIPMLPQRILKFGPGILKFGPGIPMLPPGTLAVRSRAGEGRVVSRREHNPARDF